MPRIPPPPTAGASPEIEDDIPQPEKRVRTPKMAKLEKAVSAFYMMLGGAISTLPRRVISPQVKQIGIAFARHSAEIAEAWVNLAEDDKRVLKVLESLTSISGWGEVIGSHLTVIGESAPGIMPVMMPQQQQPQQQPNGSGMGPEGDMVAEMFRREMARMSESAQRQQAAAPQQIDPRFGQAPPMPQPVHAPQQQQPQQPPTRVVEMRPGRNVGMPSAADMGVGIADAPELFPSGGAENVRG